MEKPEGGAGDHDHGEDPAANAGAQSEPLSGGASFRQDANGLKEKVAGGEPEARSSGERDHQFVDQARDEEGQQSRARHPQAANGRAKGEAQSEIVKSGIPTL